MSKYKLPLILKSCNTFLQARTYFWEQGYLLLILDIQTRSVYYLLALDNV